MVGTPKNMVVAPLAAEPRTGILREPVEQGHRGAGRERAEEPGHETMHVEQGRVRMSRSSGLQPQADSTEDTPATSDPWVWTAPFGFPVVPEV